jgi:DNA-binding XRE family transcriptional regulator
MKNMKTMNWPASLKKLRAILDVTQAELAELVGVSTISIKFAECGHNPVTRKLGAKIQAATGAIIGESKLTARGLGPYEPLPGNMVISKWASYHGEVSAVQFTLKKFEAHRKAKRDLAPGECSDWTSDMVKTLEMLCRGASQVDTGKLHALRWSFMEWAREAIETFKLPMPSALATALAVRPMPDAAKSSRSPRPRRASR